MEYASRVASVRLKLLKWSGFGFIALAPREFSKEQSTPSSKKPQNTGSRSNSSAPPEELAAALQPVARGRQLLYSPDFRGLCAGV